MLVLLLLLVATPAPSPSPSPGATRQETVVVTASAVPVAFSSLARTVDVVSGERAEALAVASVPDVLRLSAAADVRARGERGVQADVSLRGASFGQTLVLLDGFRLNDPQTGHHNADLPVGPDEVERLEVLLGPGSALHGADAFGGTVNVVTRPPRKGLRGSLSAGSFDLVAGSLSGGFERGGARVAVSGSASRSSGFALERGFETFQGSARAELGPSTRLLLAHVDKDFGAAGFYGPAPSHERTRQTLATASRSFSARGWSGRVDGGYRSHGDRFLYDASRPAAFASRHRTHAASLRSVGTRGGPASRLSLGVEGGGEWIRSSALGDHGHGHAAAFGEGERTLGRATLQAGLRLDAYGRFGAAWSPSLAAAARLTNRLRWRASAGRAFRVPTFTEISYVDPNHRASPDLGPESAWAAETTLEATAGTSATASLTAFARRERDVIDWVRATAAEPWRTTNVRAVDVSGVEARASWAPGPGARLDVAWVWLDSRPEELPLLSKYVSDFARHSLSLSGSTPLLAGLELGPRLSWKRRSDGRSAWLVDARLARQLGRARLHVDVANALDVDHQEIRGVDMPGRSLEVGLSWR